MAAGEYFMVGDRVEVTQLLTKQRCGTIIEVFQMFPQVFRYTIRPDAVMSVSGQMMELAIFTAYPSQMRKLSFMDEIAVAAS